MAKTIRVEQSHNKDPKEVRSRTEAVLSDMASKYDLKITWTSDTKVEIARSGVSGWAEILPDKVVVELKLSFPVSALAGKVEERLRAKMSKELS